MHVIMYQRSCYWFYVSYSAFDAKKKPEKKNLERSPLSSFYHLVYDLLMSLFPET